MNSISDPPGLIPPSLAVKPDPFDLLLEDDESLEESLWEGDEQSWVRISHYLRQQDRVMYSEKPPCRMPTSAAPHTDEKIRVLEARAEAGVSLWHVDDARDLGKCGMVFTENWKRKFVQMPAEEQRLLVPVKKWLSTNRCGRQPGIRDGDTFADDTSDFGRESVSA